MDWELVNGYGECEFGVGVGGGGCAAWMFVCGIVGVCCWVGSDGPRRDWTGSWGAVAGRRIDRDPCDRGGAIMRVRGWTGGVMVRTAEGGVDE